MQHAERPRIGVGIDTGRYGHRATFLRPDKQYAAKPLDFAESAEGYAQLRAVIERLQAEHVDCDIHLDAAGQYAANLQSFLRRLPQLSISVGDPIRNKEYREFIAPSHP